MLKKLGLGFIVAAALAGAALSQAVVTSGLWNNLPLVGGASYSCGSNNGVSNCTVPAGPTVVTGSETIPANSGASGTTTPQTVLIGLASLNAMPISFVTVTTPPTGISATNLSGGVVYTSTTTITSANVTLPLNPIDGQQYRISSNRTITTLGVSAAAGASMGGNSAPTVLTASTTSPQGYVFRYNAADTSWYRLQ